MWVETFDTFDQSEEETGHYQKNKDIDKDEDRDKDNQWIHYCNVRSTHFSNISSIAWNSLEPATRSNITSFSMIQGQPSYKPNKVSINKKLMIQLSNAFVFSKSSKWFQLALNLCNSILNTRCCRYNCIVHEPKSWYRGSIFSGIPHLVMFIARSQIEKQPNNQISQYLQIVTPQ